MATTKSTGSPAVPRKRGTAAGAGRIKPSLSLKHEDKLTAILRTAAQQFATNGYEATSLDMIADQLGMHKATLYHYVDNKESILYQCLLRSFGDLDAVMTSMEDRTIPVVDRLRIFVRSLVAAQNNDYGRCQVLVGSRPLDTKAGGEIQRFKRRLDQTVRNLITEGIADGSIKPCHPGMFSALLFGALNWVPRWYKDSGKFSIQDVADSFIDMLIHGVEAPSRG